MEENSLLNISVTFPEGLSGKEFFELAEKLESGEITQDNITDYLDIRLV